MDEKKISIGLRVCNGDKPRAVVKVRCACGAERSVVLPVNVRLPCVGCRWDVENPQHCLGCKRNPNLKDRWEL